MATFTPRTLAGALLMGAFSALASAQTPEPPAAILTLRVTPAASGATLLQPGGEARVILSFTPEIAAVAPARSSPDDRLTPGLLGPSIVWTTPPGVRPAALTAAAHLTVPGAASFDDRAARAVHWPIRGWPADAAPWLQPDAHADELDQNVRRLVEGWLGAQTRSVTPAVLAKYLAARTLKHAPPTLEPLVAADAPGETLGLRTRGVAGFARSGAGSEFDMLRVYAASLRIAGIPSRIVVGARAAGADASLHAWVEFYLYDERDGEGRWTPVDLVSQRRAAPEPPPIADPWRCFGQSDGALVPLFVGVPPALADDPTVRAPWRVECEPPCAPYVVTARFTATGEPRLAKR